MARLIFEGLTLEQAKELAHWYEGSGEQQAADWFECRDADLDAPMADCGFDGWLCVDIPNQTVTMKVK